MARFYSATVDWFYSALDTVSRPLETLHLAGPNDCGVGTNSPTLNRA